MLEQPVELFLEFRIGLGARVFLLKIEHQRHQRLGHIPPAKSIACFKGQGKSIFQQDGGFRKEKYGVTD
jgi:hypothetical protein